MEGFQRAFIEFALDSGVLRFGNFVLKSGRESPYFFNSGLFNSGARLARLGNFYAEAVVASGVEFDMLFGAAYKGIPLVAATSMALATHFDRDVPYCFNRKEAKNHGEQGATVGAPLEGRVLIVDDVISAGTSVREAMGIIGEAGAVATGVLIALDRQERGAGSASAIDEIRAAFALDVVSIATLDQIIEVLSQKPEMASVANRVRTYRSKYGVASLSC